MEKEEQRQDWHLEKAVMRSVEEDPELRRAEEEEHKRKFEAIENDDDPRGSEAEREREREVKRRNQNDHLDRGVDHPSDDARGTKKSTEDDGEHEQEKRQDSMIVNCLSEEVTVKSLNQK